MVMSYGPINRIFLQGKIRRFRGENPVSSRRPFFLHLCYSEARSSNRQILKSWWYEAYPGFCTNFFPVLGLIFSPFFCPPVGLESVSERANPTLLFKTPFRIHFLPPFFIPFLPPFSHHSYPCFSHHSYPRFHTIPTLVFIPILPPFFILFLQWTLVFHTIPTHVFFSPAPIPAAVQQCVNVARPCPQCKNLDNSANSMNSHLLVVLLQESK